MKILFLGHSLVAFHDWQERFPQHVIENLGAAGETAAGLLERIDTITAGRADPDAFLVMTGTNDLFIGAEDLAGTIGEIIGKLRQNCPEALVVIKSVIPVHPRWAAAGDIVRLNDSVAAIARERDAVFLDLTGLFTDEKGLARPELFLDDGIHLSDEGYRVWSLALEEWLALASR